MTRPAYQLNADDFRHATAYLGNRIRSFEIDFRDLSTIEEAKQQYYQLASSRPSKAAAERLQAWCDTYLTAAEWQLAKSSIRKRRQRWAPTKALKTITISQRAHRLLSQLAKRDNVTLSEAIELNLPSVLNQLPKTTSRRR